MIAPGSRPGIVNFPPSGSWYDFRGSDSPLSEDDSVKRTLAAFAILIAFTASALAAGPVTWNDLKDPEAGRFEDPYAALAPFQLKSLGMILRLRQQLTASGLSDEDRRQMEVQLLREEAKLAAAGLNVDRLLSQRETVARNRARAAVAGNPSLEGAEISISGYVIPVAGRDGQATGGYLVPEAGMCSHMPAPDPNQMIRYTLKTDWRATEVYQPVRLSGRLILKPTRRTIMLLDGEVEMISVFQMDVTEASPVEESGPGTDSRAFPLFSPLKRLLPGNQQN